MLVVKFNKNDDQWSNYPHMYKQSSDYTCSFIKNQFPTHSSHCFSSLPPRPAVLMRVTIQTVVGGAGHLSRGIKRVDMEVS